MWQGFFVCLFVFSIVCFALLICLFAFILYVAGFFIVFYLFILFYFILFNFLFLFIYLFFFFFFFFPIGQLVHVGCMIKLVLHPCLAGYCFCLSNNIV